MTPEQWNASHPIGTPVRVTSVQAGHGHPAQTFDTVTRSKCWALGHGTPVVLVHGKTGGYSVLPGWMEVIENPASTQMRINIKIELMPDAMHEFVLVSVADCDNAELTARILAMADKVLSAATGSKINEPLPWVKTVTSYWVPTEAGMQAAEAVKLSLCEAGFAHHCGPVTRITPSPSEYQPSKYEATEEPCP